MPVCAKNPNTTDIHRVEPIKKTITQLQRKAGSDIRRNRGLQLSRSSVQLLNPKNTPQLAKAPFKGEKRAARRPDSQPFPAPSDGDSCSA